MAKRKGLSKKVRFEVFKRDSFTCQYCGSKAPDTILHVDHIDPVANGGSDNLINLVTACQGCNSGKGATLLSDNSVLEKQRAQLDELQLQREQLDMMIQWQRGLCSIGEEATAQVASIWSDLVPGSFLTESGCLGLAVLLRKHGVEHVVSAMRESVSKIELDDDNNPTADSVDAAWQFVCKITRLEAEDAKRPGTKRIAYISGIVRNRSDYWSGAVMGECRRVLRDAFDRGVPLDDLEEMAKGMDDWDEWVEDVGALPIQVGQAS